MGVSSTCTTHIYISISHHLKRITPFYDFQLNLPRYDSLHYYVLMFVFCFFDYRVSIYLKTKELNFGTQLNCLNMNASLSLIFYFFLSDKYFITHTTMPQKAEIFVVLTILATNLSMQVISYSFWIAIFWCFGIKKIVSSMYLNR